MTLESMIKQRVGSDRYQTLTRIKIGKGLMIFAALPLASAWAFIPGLILSCPLSPTVWAKSKMICFKESWSLKWITI